MQVAALSSLSPFIPFEEGVEQQPEIKINYPFTKKSLEEIQELYSKKDYKALTRYYKKEICIDSKNINIWQRLANLYFLRSQDLSSCKRAKHLTISQRIYATVLHQDCLPLKSQEEYLHIALIQNDLKTIVALSKELVFSNEGQLLLQSQARHYQKSGEMIKALLMAQALLLTEVDVSSIVENLNANECQVWHDIQAGSIKSLEEYEQMGFKFEAPPTDVKREKIYRIRSTAPIYANSEMPENKEYTIAKTGYPLETIPFIPAYSCQPNLFKATVWINQHPNPETREVAQAIIKLTQYISFAQFEESLTLAVEDFNQRLLPGEKYVVAVKPEKSNKWMLELVRPNLKFSPYDVVEIGKVPDYLTQHLEVEKVVFMDDASYSGEQLSRYLKDEIPANSPVQVHLIVPYLTKRAVQVIQNQCKQAVLCHYQQMPTINEVIQQRDLADRISKMYFSVSRGAKDLGIYSHTMVVFDHKIADYLSTLEDVYKNGVVKDLNGETVITPLQTIFPTITRFVKFTKECYKDPEVSTTFEPVEFGHFDLFD